ncbi:GNAT family N-acetyltransferase [Pseudomonas cichorii]|uniref:GNAT family N-acetyltransferase n=1 Tax=Pseudomonas cichorii TaxID=36746 RepID=UPI001C8919C8|nr:GNAT family N-acetyltransferase [Pseudomonas cichorii]MBX8495908.1 hypothetical protein [Pseudomonas cichorii]MBX8515092.1 hypothetical protein [Pseudomonas cichorii]MBX8577506.1 hypothetical protein [Pseudomonas cichorii]
MPAQHDLSLGYNPSLGWVQGLKVDRNTLHINHLALDKSLCRSGFGTRLVHAIGNSVKEHAGITHLLFTEKNQDAVYDRFFSVKLGATKDICHFDKTRSEWLWRIP